ncbi:hypothetical protein ACRALDRAFT_209605 [Sodiomyces alcalophilus JCM 7366]|uniref:uncharacterized protein n=1 Tax=Sodiomyces alcalophilus JCM 7366 TaxID=591952 RepID=UPI0039B3B0BD
MHLQLFRLSIPGLWDAAQSQNKHITHFPASPPLVPNTSVTLAKDSTCEALDGSCIQVINRKPRSNENHQQSKNEKNKPSTDEHRTHA